MRRQYHSQCKVTPSNLGHHHTLDLGGSVIQQVLGRPQSIQTKIGVARVQQLNEPWKKVLTQQHLQQPVSVHPVPRPKPSTHFAQRRTFIDEVAHDRRGRERDLAVLVLLLEQPVRSQPNPAVHDVRAQNRHRAADRAHALAGSVADADVRVRQGHLDRRHQPKRVCHLAADVVVEEGDGRDGHESCL